MTPIYICVEGNIGAGKTTLVNAFEADDSIKVLYERFIENPFLEAFYKKPSENALSVELAFLTDRYLHLKTAFDGHLENKRIFLADFSFYKCLIFAQVNLDEKDFDTYKKYFYLLEQKLVKPDLILYLNTPLAQLQANIMARGRPMEKAIRPTYLQQIEESYSCFFKTTSISNRQLDADYALNLQELRFEIIKFQQIGNQ